MVEGRNENQGHNLSKINSARKRKIRSKLTRKCMCFYCKRNFHKSILTLDHKIPKSRGGSNKLQNLVAACKQCNNKKGSMTHFEYLEKISNNEDT